VIFMREPQRRLGGGYLHVGLLNGRVLQLQLGVDGADFRLSRLAVGHGLAQCGLKVPVIDAGENLASLDRLVVGYRDFADVAGDAGGDQRVVGLDVGIVGLDHEAAGAPVVRTVLRRGREPEHRQRAQRGALQ
jgi:hypothetical protein